MSEKEIKTVSEEASAAANAEPVYAKRATPKKPVKMKKAKKNTENLVLALLKPFSKDYTIQTN